ncbi:MAG: glycosyltransferase [Candidatus Aquicultor sp.]
MMYPAEAYNEYSLPAQNKKTRPKISIVIPVYNEEQFLPAAATDLYDGLQQLGVAFEIILCENGSTDDTRQIAKGLSEDLHNVRALTIGAADYGRAMRAGMVAAKAPYIFIFDIDYYSVEFLKEALGLLKQYDVVIASKLAPGADDRRSFSRKMVTQGFHLFNKTLFNVKVRETHGMKAFNRKKIKPIIERACLAKDLFDTELVIRAEQSGLRIKEVPVVVEEKRPARSSMVKRIPRTIIGLFMLRYFLWKEHLARGSST